MVFLKLVHTEYQVNHKTQPFWVKGVHLVPNVQTLARHVVGAIRLAPTTTLHFNTVHKIIYGCRLTPHCQITNEWIYWKKLLIWICYFLITSFLTKTRFLIFWIFRPLAPPLSCFDTLILVQTSCHWHHIIY